MTALWHALPQAASLPLGLAAGLALGACYFRAVWCSARLLAAGNRTRDAVALTAGRFALLGGMLGLAARCGAAALLSTACGLLIARAIVMRKALRAMPS